MTMTKSAIDRIGERLRADPRDATAIGDLGRYCEKVRRATEDARTIVVDTTTYFVTSRDGKSLKSIVEKLRRLKIRLSQMQDIEGCRCVVDTVAEQDALIERLCSKFEILAIDDRRAHPSNGYRAVHLVPTINGAQYEIQIRSRLQHLWAQAVERIADSFGDPDFKYGGGDGAHQFLMLSTALDIDALEDFQRKLSRLSHLRAELREREIRFTERKLPAVEDLMGGLESRLSQLLDGDQLVSFRSDRFESVWTEISRDDRMKVVEAARIRLQDQLFRMISG